MNTQKQNSPGGVKKPREGRNAALMRQYRKDIRVPAVVTAVMFALWHVIGEIVFLSDTRNSTLDLLSSGSITRKDYLHNVLNRSEELLGFGGWNAIVTLIAAALLALCGYRWLLDKRSVDFYESQPVSRKRRYFLIFENGFIVYILSYLVTVAVGFLITVVFAGGCTGGFLISVLSQLANNLILFFAAYAVSILAVMLTGTIVTAVLADCVLLLYEMAVRVIVESFFSTYFDTYVSDEGAFRGFLWASPLYNAMQQFWPAIFENLVFGICVFVLAYFAYRKRPNEAAGTAVVFRPVRAAVKIAIASLVGMSAGLMFSGTTGIGVFVTVLAAFLMGCVMEWIYSDNIKRSLQHMPETVASVGISVFVTLIFTMDLFGYDSWIPSADSVQSAAILTDDYTVGQYKNNGEEFGPSDYESRYMKLTDIEDIRSLAKTCIQNSSDEVSGCAATVLYRMKNGKTAKRGYTIPEDVSVDLMDKIIGTEAYKEGYYQIYHDGFLTGEKGKLNFDYSNGFSSVSAEADYNKFRSAYLKDLKKLDFSYGLSHPEIGMIDITRYTKNNTYDIQYIVYDGFENTISFLENAGIYVKPLSAGDVKSIEVSFDPEGDAVREEDGTFVDVPEQTYTDEKQMEQIMNHIVSDNFSGPFDWALSKDSDYTVTIITKEYGEQGGYLFREGEVPDFVKADLADESEK